MVKDLQLAVDAGLSKGVQLEIGSATLDMYSAVVNDGLGQKDFSVVYDYLSNKKSWKGENVE